MLGTDVGLGQNKGVSGILMVGPNSPTSPLWFWGRGVPLATLSRFLCSHQSSSPHFHAWHCKAKPLLAEQPRAGAHHQSLGCAQPPPEMLSRKDHPMGGRQKGPAHPNPLQGQLQGGEQTGYPSTLTPWQPKKHQLWKSPEEPWIEQGPTCPALWVSERPTREIRRAHKRHKRRAADRFAAQPSSCLQYSF